jgi:hypothetical protein
VPDHRDHRSGPGDASPLVAVPLLGTGASLAITFRVTVASSLPPGLENLSAQATVTGSDVAPAVSDDPDTPEPLDPTLTPLAAATGPPPARGVPTLGGIGITTLVALLAAAGLARLRRPGRAICASGAIGTVGATAAGGATPSPATGGHSAPR